ncbi:HAMP domain-containing histidine kinase [bacterium]|nr:HAMP domain-containing histidine kinase [bacterium]
MDIEDLAREHYQVKETITRHSDTLLTELLGYHAAENDRNIQTDLLMKLVMSYASLERQLVELNQLKNKFLGIAAHDLRNPLASIRGFCELLLEDEESLTADQIEMITIMYSASENMLGLVNDLLDVAAIESGKLRLRFGRVSLRSVIEERIRILTIVAQKKSMHIHTSFEDVPECQADQERIGQVIDNLFSNAVKYSPPGSNIHVSLEREGMTAKVGIRDEGPGISEEEQARLFGEFQRLSSRPTGGEKSTGLGLAIVKKIVEAHHGTVSVRSMPGQGSTFSFTVPLE